MIFSSLVFIWFFLPAAVLLYTLAPGRTAKNVVLLISGLLFYSFGEPKYIVLLLFTAGTCYLAGLAIDACRDKPQRKKWTAALFIVLQLLLLGYFKYYNFFAASLNRLAQGQLLELREIVLPLGISFYTFQAISYIADIAGGRAKAQKNPFYTILYICLFPQLLSGPIIKYHEIELQLTERNETTASHAYGIRRFTYGLAKKVLFADTFGQALERIMEVPAGQLGTLTVWLAMILYALQLYYDFSGYSDMAIGLGRMFGFRYAENFNYPYISSSVTEFWRRWHISLSSWFKQYLYFPLGGSRKGPSRTYLNLFIIFLATGLWHGANTNFILWGICHAFFIILERCWLGKWLEKNPYKLFNHLYTLLVFVLSCVVFRGPDMETVLVLLKTMIRPVRGLWSPALFADGKIIVFMLAGMLLCGPLQTLLPKLRAHLYDEDHTTAADICIMAVLLFLSSIVIVSSTYNAFIYFQF